jgi:phage terminase large subunit-like protein
MTTRRCRLYIDEYMEAIESGEIPASRRLRKAMPYIRSKLDTPGVYIDEEKTKKAVELIEKYFEIKLVPWELFIIALVHAYHEDGTLVFTEFFILVGRGNGKNKFISGLTWYLSTHYHGIPGYNIDIIANSQEQAMTSFNDIYEVLELTWAKSKKFFYKTKQIIVNLKTNSYIKYNTSNSRTKDGRRSACLVFDEVHEYENWDLINVFRSGFGKREHSRIFYITTNGYVRGGVLDELLELSDKVLSGEITNLRFLPLIYEIDEEEERDDPAMWVKANPSLPYFPTLRFQMEQDYELSKHQPSMASEFMTKRMNRPAVDSYTVVAPWEKIIATNQPIPWEELEGQSCIGAFDYAQINDFASCGLLFKYKGKRYWIEHTFVCHLALKMENRKIKFPVEEMAQQGLITIVYGDIITPEHIANWFIEQARKYHIIDIVADRYRAEVVRDAFTKAGLSLSIIPSGPITHAKVAPLITTMFAEETIIFGDNPTMRWYVNNTCQVLDAKGNTTYHKIEPRTRKTDGFFALVHALSKDSELQDPGDFNVLSLGVYTY